MINWTKIKHDVSGNPRYVCHYSNLLTEEERKSFSADTLWIAPGHGVSSRYEWAIERSHKLGGRKYHTKSYGGGIVFQSYNLNELEKDISKLLEQESNG